MSESPDRGLRIEAAAAAARRSGAAREVGPSDYLRILSKRRWAATAVFLTVFVTSVVYTFTRTPIYESRATILIESENPNIVDFKEVVQEGQGRGDYYATQYSILQSRSLARKTIDELNLWTKPVLATGKAENAPAGIAGALRGAADWVTSWFTPAKPDRTEPRAADETYAQTAAIDGLLGGLSVTPVRNSRLVYVSYRSPDPSLATNIVNTLSRLYIAQNLEFKFLTSKEASEFLAGQLTEQRAKVEESEAALQRYRESNDAVSLEERQNIVVQKLEDLNAAATHAKTTRIEKESLYNQLHAMQSAGNTAALDTFPAIISNSVIQQLKVVLGDQQRQRAQLAQTYGEKHPNMTTIESALKSTEARLQAEIGKVVQSVRNEFLAAQSQERSLNEALDQQKREAQGLGKKGIEYGVLLREAQSNRQLYDSLLSKAKQTGVSGELRASNIRVVDAAELPRSPVLPRTRLNLSVGLFGGFFLAIGVAFFLDFMDNRIKTPEEIKAHLGIPFLGLIPDVGTVEGMAGSPILSKGVPANFAEAFRVVRTNILFSSAESGIRSVVITSSGPSEGKSVVASNLAIGLAQSGLRVLIVDADMRRPRVHEILGYPCEPGLSNLLVGTSKASESVRKTEVPGLWVLPAGRIPPNPAELVGSQRFRDFLASLSEHFDWVIIDSPPVMAVTDAAIIGNSVSGAIFVIGAEMTSRNVARNALDWLAAAHVKPIGAILNRVDLQRNSYYYSQYYRREYSKYYAKAETP
jgi:succinoglycan biosynthesis transport protein ExoP